MSHRTKKKNIGIFGPHMIHSLGETDPDKCFGFGRLPCKRCLRWVVIAAVIAYAFPAMAAEPAPPEPFGAVPTPQHLAWHALEYYGFIHFTLNTFTDREWGHGDETPELFNPSELDTDQWARVAKEAGMTGLILTAKHHDGFCLWPSKYTEHSVKNSPWKNGQGDVVRELADACRRHGLKFGVYLSPWDRNHAEYAGSAYVTYYQNQTRELLTGYGEIFETWYDGANGGTGYYGGANEDRKIDRHTYYDWPTTWRLARKLQPNVIRFSDVGPDIRWIGNERGHAGDPCWSMYTPHGLGGLPPAPGATRYQEGENGHPNGAEWIPAEVDVSIRPGWFWHASQDDQVKTLDQLLDIYYASVGRGCNLLLNIPPDRRGRFHENDVARLQEFGRVLRETFKNDLARGKTATADHVRGNSGHFGAHLLTDGDRNTYWATDDDIRAAVLEVQFDEPTEFDRIRVQEFIPLGQRVAAFEIDSHIARQWQRIATGMTIGPRRILRVPRVQADALRIRITECLASPALSAVEVFNTPGAP